MRARRCLTAHPRVSKPALLITAVTLLASVTAPASDAETDFFEQRIRPVLIEHCAGCHSQQAGKRKGGLLVDSREALLQGGDSGPALVPGDPARSRLIAAVVATDGDLEMPPKGSLPEALICDLRTWV